MIAGRWYDTGRDRWCFYCKVDGLRGPYSLKDQRAVKCLCGEHGICPADIHPFRPTDTSKHTDEDLFVHYMPAVIGWQAIRDPGRSTDDFFLDCEAAVKEFIRQHRITFAAGPSLLSKEEDSK